MMLIKLQPILRSGTKWCLFRHFHVGLLMIAPSLASPSLRLASPTSKCYIGLRLPSSI